jgi:hypothetical protein
MNASELTLDLGTVTMTCTTEEVAATFAWLLTEMQAAVPRLRPDERIRLRIIMSQESGTLTVGDVFPDFQRDSEEHKTLRRLRAGQFIRPAVSGRWELDELIEVKPFGRLMWERVGEEGIFPTPARLQPAVPASVSFEEPVEELDLAAPEVNDPATDEDRERQPVAAWSDNDVLDYLNDSKENYP